jgi:hypothetical protein
MIDLDKFEKSELNEFIELSCDIIISYANEKSISMDLILKNAPAILKQPFLNSIRNLRDEKINYILKDDEK